jgi:hypothetical protein
MADDAVLSVGEEFIGKSKPNVRTVVQSGMSRRPMSGTVKMTSFSGPPRDITQHKQAPTFALRYESSHHPLRWPWGALGLRVFDLLLAHERACGEVGPPNFKAKA